MLNLRRGGIAGALLSIFIESAAAAPPAVDNQYWGEVDATHPLSSDFSVTGIVTAHIGNQLPNPTFTGVGLQLDYVTGQFMTSGGSYFVSIRSAGSGEHITARLPFIAETYKVKYADVTLTDRNRIEEVEGVPNSPRRYRNRFGLDWSLSGNESLTHIFATDEVFYDFSRSQWTRNRAQVGLTLSITQNAALLVFYLRQQDNHGAPNRLNVIGTTLQMTIR